MINKIKGFSLIVFILFILLAFLLPACEEESSSAEEQAVATVNGEEISRRDFGIAFDQELQQLQMQGIDFSSPDMEGALEELELFVLENYFIIPILVAQQAEAEGITVSDEEIEERFQQFAASYGGEELLLQHMQEINFTREDINRDIRQELLINSYLDYYIDQYLINNPEAVVNEEDIEVEAYEIEEFYAMITEEYQELQALLEEDDPTIPAEQVESYLLQLENHYGNPLDPDNFNQAALVIEAEIRSMKAAQLEEQLLQHILADHITELQDSGTIEILL